MTNHPRRVNRRKHQRQRARVWTDLAPFIQSVRLGNGLGWQPSAIAVRSALDAHRIHVHHPRQRQLKGAM